MANLYWDDGLAWSEQQAGLLKRLRAGERVNEAIDWENVIEEIEQMGRSELRTVASMLRLALEHLLKIVAWPGGPVEHWRAETIGFLANAAAEYTPAMAGRLDVPRQFSRALASVSRQTIDGQAPRPMPTRCPFSEADLIVGAGDELPDVDALLARLAAAQ